jgi:hypothetical protein
MPHHAPTLADLLAEADRLPAPAAPVGLPIADPAEIERLDLIRRRAANDALMTARCARCGTTSPGFTAITNPAGWVCASCDPGTPSPPPVASAVTPAGLPLAEIIRLVEAIVAAAPADQPARLVKAAISMRRAGHCHAEIAATLLPAVPLDREIAARSAIAAGIANATLERTPP